MDTSIKIAAAAFALALGGCAYPPAGSGDYRGYEVRGEQSVRFGVVESVRDVRITPHDTGVGTAGGAALGAVAGSTVGGGNGQIAGAIGGAILGGIIGQNIEQQANQKNGVEITVLLDSGKYIAIVQGADEQFRAGDRVRILSGPGGTRVTH
ncbi:MAG TPA: glycine zipper 2TM domain-containing protein [Usitatibacter sp.]|nr:glycine zipper 2TM domain-containing protein [Usitatibacter sp.]